MKVLSIRMVTGMAALALVSGSVLIGVSWGSHTRQSANSRVVAAANAFLASLSEEQRKKELFAFDDATQRARWSNFPTGFVKRAGLSLKTMTPAQRIAAMALVASVLSKRGYEKVEQIMEADEVFKATDGARDQSMFGKDLYYISILGTPSETSPWMLQYGGHHLALNITISGDKGVLTPTLTGAQPALYVENGKAIRPLAGESDKAVTLLDSLDEAQKKQAVVGYQVADLVLGPGQDGKTIVPEGLKVSAMNAHQKQLLLDVISEWAGIGHESMAKGRMAEIKEGLDQTWFAWSGPTTEKVGHNISAYYRIQGPKLVIEYAPQSLGGDLSLHVHTIYRDPTNDYGQGITAK